MASATSHFDTWGGQPTNTTTITVSFTRFREKDEISSAIVSIPITREPYMRAADRKSGSAGLV
jgi:hypothetical protein